MNKDLVSSLMRIEDNIKKEWSKKRKKILSENNSYYSSKEQIRKSFDELVNCFTNSIRKEYGKLQKKINKESK